MTSKTVQVHRIYIKAKPQAVWDAITRPEWIERYGYGGRFADELVAGKPFRILSSDDMKKAGVEMGFEVPDVAVDGEVVEMDPPRKLVMTWRMAMDPTASAEGFTRLTYELAEEDGGFVRLTLIHDLTGAPTLAEQVAGGDAPANQGGGGWPWVLSDLKSLLETGAPLAG